MQNPRPNSGNGVDIPQAARQAPTAIVEDPTYSVGNTVGVSWDVGRGLPTELWDGCGKGFFTLWETGIVGCGTAVGGLWDVWEVFTVGCPTDVGCVCGKL